MADMKADNPNSRINNSDELHNQNCFAFLKILKPVADKQQVPELTPLFDFPTDYTKSFAYGNVYTAILERLEQILDNIESRKSSIDIKKLDPIINAVYHNDNRIIEQTDWLINPISKETTPSNNPKHKITNTLKDKGTDVNKITPQKADKFFNVIASAYPNYKPQNQTNIPSLKHYDYLKTIKKHNVAVEYRFSTQAQRHDGTLRISPLFKRWLQIRAALATSQSGISHIYFNNLGLDRKLPDVAGFLEHKLSLTLHKLEEDPLLKIAVITLPAAKGLLNPGNYKKNHDALPSNAVYQELLRTAMGSGHPSGISDLLISPKIQKILFPYNEQKIVMQFLLKNCFQTMGIPVNSFMSTAQKQAVWFHFCKFELPNYIIETLKPNGINFSCKDAIDRGAVSSAYYNLMKSIELKPNLSQEEFDRALHSAAANARGRGMNFHREIIWNALDAYVNNNYTKIYNNKSLFWLINWRDMNCPHERVASLIPIRLKQTRAQIKALKNKPVEQLALKIMDNIEQQVNLSGKRVLLDIISKTADLLKNPSEAAKINYTNLAKTLPIEYPSLHILAGLMKAFIGVIFYPLTFGYSKPLIHEGLATLRSGFFAEHKQKLHDDMLLLAPPQTVP
jgi:hypothetical protein